MDIFYRIKMIMVGFRLTIKVRGGHRQSPSLFKLGHNPFEFGRLISDRGIFRRKYPQGTFLIGTFGRIIFSTTDGMVLGERHALNMLNMGRSLTPIFKRNFLGG